MNKKSILIGAAIVGIVGAGSVVSTTSAFAAEKGLCKGASTCSGKGACGELKGKNDCAGKGAALMSKAACDKKKLEWTAMPAKGAKPAPAEKTGA